MIGSVNMNVSQANAALANNGVGQVKPKTQTAPEQNENKTTEALESRRMQVGENESRAQGAQLLDKLQQNESRQVYAAADQVRANAQATRVTGMRAYSEAGKSELNAA
ncbi:MAG: hypothetical protein LWX83_00285 [Anaerolineae bacterium]|nr:hypothetical protein [Anaerolineae bacterium]